MLGSPWLDGVSNLTTFDQALSDYVTNTYVTSKYVLWLITSETGIRSMKLTASLQI